jgi:hypothetical protein
VSLWSVADPGGPVRAAELDTLGQNVTAISFSPDGATLATAGSDASLWNVRDIRHPRLAGKFTPGPVVSLAFSPDGRTLWAGSTFSATMWDTVDRTDPVQVTTIMPLPHPPAFHAAAAFSRDGRALMMSTANVQGTDGVATMWDLTDLANLRADARPQACAIAGRGLNKDEWARYIPELPYANTCPGRGRRAVRVTSPREAGSAAGAGFPR